jgi:hypothetical protein
MGGFCAPGGGPPPPDRCDVPQTRAVVDAIEIGRPDGDTFQTLPDGYVARVVYGPQGGAMLEFRLRVTGSAPPECLDQITTVNRQGAPIGSRTTPLRTYADAPGTRATRTLQVILDSRQPPLGTMAEVTVEAHGKTATKSFWIDAIGD